MTVFIVEPIHEASDSDYMADRLMREGFITYRRDEEDNSGSKAYAFLAVAPDKLSSDNILSGVARLKLNSGLFRYRRCHAMKQKIVPTRRAVQGVKIKSVSNNDD